VITVGIDIGLTGAIAATDHRGIVAVHDLPLADGRLCGLGLFQLLRNMVPLDEAGLVIIEDVRPRPMVNGNARGNTMHSQGSLMRSRGIVEAAVDIARLQLRVVQPQTWKRHFGLLRTEKDEARQVALRLFPMAADALKRKKDHNRADALLIAHYGQGAAA
jgi:hypothetical protein